MLFLSTLTIVSLIIHGSVTVGEEVPCEECINIEHTQGHDPKLVGSYKLRSNQADYDCPASCAYEKEDDDPGNVWCFKPGAYKFSAKCYNPTAGLTPYSIFTKSPSSTVSYPASSYLSSTLQSTLTSSTITSSNPTATTTSIIPPVPTIIPPVTKKTIFVEGDTVVEQEDSFDPTTGDLTLKVPAHGKNVAVTVLISGSSNARSNPYGMVTSFDDYCLLGEVPANYSTSTYTNQEESDEFSNSTLKSHFLNVIEGELTDEERYSLPESFQNTCKDKPIKKGRKVLVTEDNFDLEDYDNYDNDKRTKTMHRDTTCGNPLTSCSKFDRGCYFYWSNPSGGGDVQVQVHSISYTLQCLSCCVEESTPKLCKCSDIKSGGQWRECYKKTNGECDFKGWKCESNNKCLSYSEQCDKKCYGSLEPCGDSCVVPKTDTASSFQYSCQDKCVDSSVKCEGECPKGTTVCGTSCVPNWYREYYAICNGICQPSYKSCDGTLVCLEGAFECDGFCRGKRQGYVLCNGNCQSISVPCNSKCPEGYLDCDGVCKDKNFYKLCDGKCVRYDTPCNGLCQKGQFICDGKCMYDYFFTNCNGKCQAAGKFCNGKCTEGYFECGAWSNSSGVNNTNGNWDCGDRRSIYICNGECQPKYIPCNGKCPDGFIDCGEFLNNKEYCGTENLFYVCNGKCQFKFASCDGTCPKGFMECDDGDSYECQGEKYSYICDGKCKTKDNPCNGGCYEDFIYCNDQNQCIRKEQECDDYDFSTFGYDLFFDYFLDN